MVRLVWILVGINGFLAVAAGAFGAHGLERWLTEPDAAKRLSWWQTASHYHLVHSLALAISAYLCTKDAGMGRAAAYCFQLGILLFSGSLYAMTLTGLRGLGAITPLGGLALLAGWAAVAIAGFRSAG